MKVMDSKCNEVRRRQKGPASTQIAMQRERGIFPKLHILERKTHVSEARGGSDRFWGYPKSDPMRGRLWWHVEGFWGSAGEPFSESHAKTQRREAKNPL